jgi:antitoxin component YwqK of YwqJK toxin-antitoxin module
MTRKLFLLFFFIAFLTLELAAQEPKYSPGHFVVAYDSLEFRSVIPQKEGLARIYLEARPEIWDVDDDKTTYIRAGKKVLLCSEGMYKNGQKSGLYNVYLIDSFEHKKRYKIWEQTYSDDKLNGEWNIYTLKGKLVSSQNYKNDSLSGTTKTYWIDGKSLVEEREYFNGGNKYVLKEYAENGKVTQETTIINDVGEGPSKTYYTNGALKDEVNLKNGVPDGLRRYYYPSGKIWIEQEYKNGNLWTVIANYTIDGKKKDPGTLKKGNGTVIFYNDDGTVRETAIYRNGVRIGQ